MPLPPDAQTPRAAPKSSLWTPSEIGAAWAIVLAAAVVRIALFSTTKSFTQSEAPIAAAIQSRSLADLLKPTENQVLLPTLYAALQKLAYNLRDSSPQSLHALPLIASILSAILLLTLAKRLFSPGAGLFALALYATLPPLLHAAVDLAPDGFDILASLIVLTSAAQLLEQPKSPLWQITFVAAGVLAVFLSISVIFTLIITFAAILLTILSFADFTSIITVSIAGALWLAALAGEYFAQIHYLQSDSAFRDAFSNTFPPAQISQLPPWLWNWTQSLFHVTLSIPFWQLSLLATLLGVVLTFRKSPALPVLLLAPLLLALCASWFHGFPPSGPSISFAIPGLLLLTAAGQQSLWDGLKPTYKFIPILTAILLIGPLIIHAVIGMAN